MDDFDRIYREQYSGVYRYLMSLCRDPVLAEELTQETFYRAYLNLSQLRQADRLKSWLFTIARSTWLLWHRRSQHTAALEEAPEPIDPADPETLFLQQDLTDRACAQLLLLEEPYREVFRLRVLGGLSHKEIGRMYQKSESWARVTYLRARQKLCQRLEL